jgi:hypothetical protein
LVRQAKQRDGEDVEAQAVEKLASMTPVDDDSGETRRNRPPEIKTAGQANTAGAYPGEVSFASGQARGCPDGVAR